MKKLRTAWSSAVLALVLTLLAGVSQARPAQPHSPILSKSSMNFGTVVLGSNTTVIEKISNPTTSIVTIAAGSIEGTGFQLSGTSFPLTIAPGQQAQIGITFTPVTAGEFAGSFQISLSGGTPYLVVVPLNGIAVASGALTANPPSINFGSGSPGRQIIETITNSGGTNITVYAATLSGSGFSLIAPALPVTLAPNQNTTLIVSIPLSSSGNASGSVNVSSRSNWWASDRRGTYVRSTSQALKSFLTIPVSATAVVSGQLTAAPSNISFGTVQTGNTQSQPAVLTNSGSGPVTITQAAAMGTGFGVSGLPLPMTLTAGESVTFSAAFTPQSAGIIQGGIFIVSNASNSMLNFQLSGTGNTAGQLTLSPASLTFGNVPTGKSQSLTATLAATGSSVTVSSASVSNAEFSLAGMQLPITIPAGQSTAFTVTFAPQANGAALGNIAFSSNGSSQSTEEALAGAGTAPPQHSVGLSWSADTSTVAGYNVYRGTQSGGPYIKVNPTLTATTAYGDAAVTAGQTYFYVTTAVDGTGSESSHSNEVQAIIPTP